MTLQSAYLTVAQASALLGYTPASVRKMLQRGSVPASAVYRPDGRTVLLLREWVESYPRRVRRWRRRDQSGDR